MNLKTHYIYGNRIEFHDRRELAGTSNCLSGDAKPLSYEASCRACGQCLAPTAICTECQENVRWVCPYCRRTHDVTHVHGYRLAPYKTIVYAGN